MGGSCWVGGHAKGGHAVGGDAKGDALGGVLMQALVSRGGWYGTRWEGILEGMRQCRGFG